MAGIQADRGDVSHRIVTGEIPTVGLEVITNNLDRGVITEVASDERPCGYYCDSWHTVELHTDYKGQPMSGKTTMNCDRLTTRMP
jgi:hypothetical protein